MSPCYFSILNESDIDAQVAQSSFKKKREERGEINEADKGAEKGKGSNKGVHPRGHKASAALGCEQGATAACVRTSAVSYAMGIKGG